MEMKTLLFMLPRIWQLEGKVAGADLGLGRFQFDFETEEDITAVLKMEPLHFDHWMVSLVRWAPSVDPNYPSSITFWIRVLGVPIEFWADQTFREIGEDLGKVEAVDIMGGRVQVTIDGFKPLCFETEIEFGNGEETVMFLQYERLFGFCELCYSLCHDKSVCGLNPASSHGKRVAVEEMNVGSHVQSFRGAVIQGAYKESGQGSKSIQGDQGKDLRAAGKEGSGRSVIGNQNVASTSQPRQFTNYAQFNEHRFSQAGEYGSKKQQSQKIWKSVKDAQVQAPKSAAVLQPKQVRKALFISQEAEGAGVADSEVAVRLEDGSGKGTERGVAAVEATGSAGMENETLVDGAVRVVDDGSVLNAIGGSDISQGVDTQMSTEELERDDLL
ncbi:unnamed protein product, partial [Arabidopsis halleri]